MFAVVAIVVLIVYAVVGWWMAFACHRQWLIKRELEKTRRELKPGFQLAPAWYSARRKALLTLWLVGPLCVAPPIVAATVAYLSDFRNFHVFMFALAASSPMLFGWWGIIPIPGIEIDT